MVVAGAGLCGFAVVSRNDSADSLFPLNLAFVGRRKIRTVVFSPNTDSGGGSVPPR